jgi:hypothetical protein
MEQGKWTTPAPHTATRRKEDLPHFDFSALRPIFEVDLQNPKRFVVICYRRNKKLIQHPLVQPAFCLF